MATQLQEGALRAIVATGSDDVVFSPDGTKLYVSFNSSIATFDVATGTRTATVAVGVDLAGMDVSPDGQYLYATDLDAPRPSFAYIYSVYRIETATGAILGRGLAESDAVPSPYNDVAVLSDGTLLLSRIGKGGLSTYPGFPFGSESVVFGTGSRIGVLTRSADRQTTLFGDTIDNDAPLFVFRPAAGISATHEDFRDGIAGLNGGVQAISTAANMIATNVGAGDVGAGTGFSIYDLGLNYRGSLAPQFAQPARFSGMAFSPSGDRLYALDDNSGEVFVIDTASLTVLGGYSTARAGTTLGPRFGDTLLASGDGRYLSIAGGGTITLLDLTKAELNLGTAGSDVIQGFGRGNVLAGGGGSDFINGGAGYDIAGFADRLDQSLVLRTATPGTLYVGSSEGTDTLTGIEALRFSDGTVRIAGGDPLVDTLYYARTYRDVYRNGIDPETHYDLYGRYEGRDPDAFFSTKGYLAANRDVAGAGVNPLDHYDQFGWREGRDPSAAFDTGLYLAHNRDVANAGLDPLAHYLQYGRYEGRATYAAIGDRIDADGFDREYYLLANPDVAGSGMSARTHYETVGWREGRDPNAWFDTSDYLAAYGDVRVAGIDPLKHYHDFGWKEGRDPSKGFDTTEYRAHYGDVAFAGIDPLVHYLMYGAGELRGTYGDGTFGLGANG